MAQTKPKAAQFYGVSGNGTAGQVLISDGNGGMSWGANTENYTVSWATPTGQSLTYTQPSPQSSNGAPGGTFPTTTFTATKSGEEISGTATIAGLPAGITASQSLSGSGVDNILTVTLAGVFPGADSLNTALTLSGLTVVVPAPLVVSYLVVAGGGSGAGDYGGGGGAGGLRTSYGSTTGGGGSAESTLTLSPSANYTVTVGSGGVGSSGSGVRGTNGTNSVFNTITSTGGGGGGAEGNYSGLTGGSGGGGGYSNGAGGAAVTSPVVQGYAGGTGKVQPYYTCGGGGGAGQLGQDADGTANGSNGGNGLSVSITGTATYYAGGGGGGGGRPGQGPGAIGEGGLGGGGDSPNSATGDNGTANTGGGGGGGQGDAGTGGNGGSGIVILRYPSSYTISGLSGTTITVGTDKVTTFTTGTGNIQFN